MINRAAELEAQIAILQEQLDLQIPAGVMAQQMRRIGELEKQIAALLVALEAKDAALDSLVSWVDDWAETSDTDFTRIETQVNAARAISTSAELLESRDRKRDAKLLRVITQRIQPQDSYQDDYFKAKVHSYNIVKELAATRESGEWKLELGE